MLRRQHTKQIQYGIIYQYRHYMNNIYRLHLFAKPPRAGRPWSSAHATRAPTLHQWRSDATNATDLDHDIATNATNLDIPTNIDIATNATNLDTDTNLGSDQVSADGTTLI